MRLISHLLFTIFIVGRLVAARKLLLLFLDGFRWDYIDNTDLKGFSQLKKQGAYVRKVIPVFPADCHPNIYSIFTGLYPQHHGVLGNRMYSSATGAGFDHDNPVHRRLLHEWVLAEPLWVTIRRNGLHSFIYHLPICDSNSGPLSPSHCVPYDRDAMTLRALNDSVREAIRSLDNGVANFAVVYNDQLDRLSHQYGPHSSQLTDELLPGLDALLQETVAAAARVGAHLVVLSDHGMARIDKERQIFLERLLLRSQIAHVANQGGYAGIWPRPGRYRQVYDGLLMARSDPGSKFRMYTRRSMPAQWNAFREDSSPPLLVVADPGYFIVSKELAFPTGSDYSYSGWHGYAPENDEMASPMLAIGPDIKPGTQVDTAHVTDIYQVLAHLLGVLPLSHNGSDSLMAAVMANGGGRSEPDIMLRESEFDLAECCGGASTGSVPVSVTVLMIVLALSGISLWLLRKS